MKNGVHFDLETGEYQIWLNNEKLTYASTEKIGNQIYLEALTTAKEHIQRNNHNTEQSAWEWSTLTTPHKQETIAALNLASVTL